MNIEYRPDESLLIARWDGPGLEEDFTNEDREILMYAEQQQCWRWLLDYRMHGDTSDYNACDLLTNVLFDAAHRIHEAGTNLRVALLLGPGFVALPKHIPSSEMQKRRRIALQVFTEEGPALVWLNQNSN